ncbi:2-oxoglutarate and iron-dependent oxygenase domain-containing protein 2-like [Mizuhopecten yessoensis]|uniref:2-oxoglutarate and iron-dependent oxygenase domain-containing protein 2 n=1 Tax=Mizuhopecten yessoensis TaxID=6573 RepID=A0A210Q1T1_MIZYE|nr:2-oxoglutarate and iron-dependent oxygenase domain-containing protein 2-like [Mizuhopecten yessoensis]XP_021369527.1 2-oxoglutarate and iron-dependent oxygenase domain-containing protein 2-like [Mizuhopecten yessoensis]XP_021369528.1 2-oxoglutarate and iron-dependent oxygenase domain-containing protein 2-like [Mizuhopecten yessoensis]XP_021369529.1 2-oxoglutarate and iron-dependent oxygenase domain-containing protein 2-like [Mizuhopecten yessoensis]OWF42700.1 2-oxoglutarate and iron-dependen
MRKKMADPKFFVCRCFYTHNYFLKDYNIHVVFENVDKFLTDFGKEMNQRGCSTKVQLDHVLNQLLLEQDRRKNLGKDYLTRRQIIQKEYHRLHPEIYTLKESYLAPEFLKLIDLCSRFDTTAEDVLASITPTGGDRVYSFPVFTKEFCQLFMEELEHFENSDCPKGRPNTMNKYGILLNELGFDECFLNPLRKNYLHKLAAILYPDWGGAYLDSHKAFIVQYKMGEDLDLNYHYDNAEVTLNVALGKNYTGGSLYFGDMRTVSVEDTECSEYEHMAGIGIVHRGQHYHGALPILTGERYNLIVWMRSSKVRNRLCPMCDQKPELVETVGYGDGFTQPTVNLCTLN